MNVRSLASRVAGRALAASLLVPVVAGEAFDGGSRLAAPAPRLAASVDSPRPEPRLRLAWYDVHGMTPGAYGAARAEASRLLDRMGIPSDWRPGRLGEAGAPEEMRVIVLNRPGRGTGAGHLTMGAVPRGAVSASLWVYLPSVLHTLGWNPTSIGPGSELWRRRDLGLALGRVVAHEVVHLLAPQLPHAGGLMSSSLNRKQMLAAEIAIDPAIVPVLQAGLRGEPGGGFPARTVLAVKGADRRD